MSLSSSPVMFGYRIKILVGPKFWLEQHPINCGFDSQSAFMPGLWVQLLVGANTGGNQSVFPSHTDVSLPSSSSKKKKNPWMRGRGKKKEWMTIGACKGNSENRKK